MANDVVRFVDSIAASPTTRLDLNDGTTFTLNAAVLADPPKIHGSISSNAMTDGGLATLPTGEVVPRAENSVIIGAMNTFGHGADRLYVGRNQLDAATLDRFVGATVEMDYDKDLECKLCPEKNIRDAIWEIRSKARKHSLRRVVSTRSLVAARRLRLGMSEELPLVLKRLTLGWSPQDRAAVEVPG